jgi:phosphonate transport system substrate-binding protein
MTGRRRVPRWTFLFAIATMVVSCGRDPVMSVQETGPESRPPGILTIGSVSLNPAAEHDVFRPLADYLAARLASVGIGRGRVVVVDSLSTMVNELDAGKVDIYFDSPFPVGFVVEHSDTKVLLRRFKRGAKDYRSVLFSRAGEGVETLADLRGRVIAFGEPFSTTGYILPKAALVSDGFKLVNFEDPAATVPDDEIGYVFSNDAENTMVWVLKGKATAGAVNEDYFEALAGSRIGELKILYRSKAVPRNIVCARGDLDPEVVRAVVGVLLGMDEDISGREVLTSFEQTSRFEVFPEGGQQALASVIELLPFVEEDLGR